MAQAVISLCLPSRQRAERFAQMRASALTTSKSPIEFCVLLDEDEADAYPTNPDTRYFRKSGLKHSEMWNAASVHARGDILMMCADDLAFKTPGWDAEVRAAFQSVPDRILVTWADDATPHKLLATHPFLSREWVGALGQLTPPYYEAWNADSWILDLGLKTGRLRYLSQVVIEHRHVDYGTAQMDSTYELRMPLRSEPVALSHRPDWVKYEQERRDQAKLLGRIMDTRVRTAGQAPPGFYDGHGYGTWRVWDEAA